MKSLLVLAIAIFSMSSFAKSTEPEAPLGNWVCTAQGLDQNSTYRSVWGWYAETREKAESSALSECTMMGWWACRVTNCVEREQNP